MTSSAAITDPQAGEKVKESSIISTIHRAYKNDDDLVFRDPTNRRSFINRSAYAKLHRSSSAGSNRHSVGNLKGRFESLARENSQDEPNSPVKDTPSESSTEEDTKFTPASFGYPKTAKLKPPLIKPKPQIRRNIPKDVNSNVVQKSESNDGEEYRIVIQQSASEESVDKIAKELSNFTMDRKPKKRGSFRKLFLGGLFNKDKKKKEEERRKIGDNIVYNDNLKNESSFVRQAPQRQTLPVNSYNERIRNQEIHEERIKELEQKYAEMHVNRFNQIRQNFSEKREDYVPMDAKNAKSIDLVKYIDTSSSESDKPNGVVARDTPPRAKETYQNIQVVKPKSVTPSPSPRTIERNLNRSNSKEYPDKPNITPEDTYGTVFDSLEYSPSRNGDLKPVNTRSSVTSPKPPLSLESTKLRLPSNREIYEPLPRVKSPIPTNRVSTDKIIATELLKGTRSPTPPKRTVSKEVITGKPPMSPKSPRKNEPQVDRIVTNALVHAPRPETPLRAATPVELRMSVSMKMSPNKKDIRKSVEEYYWKELKKLKEEEDSRLYAMQVNGYFEEQAKLKRSRSLSPSRVGRRSLSLPRDNRVVYDGVRVQQQPIPEDQIMTGRHFVYDQGFIRGSTERRTVDSLQRPIFRRGSLSKQEIYEPQYNKRVSFSNGQQAWPTRNGYVQSPPQRRLGSELEDDVFVDSPKEPIYGTRYTGQNEPIYSNRILDKFRAQQLYESPRRQLYNQVPPQMGSRRSSMEAIPRQDIYVSRNQIRRPVSNIPEDYTRIPFQQYPSNSQSSLRNSIYSSRQSMAEPIYGQKHVSVRNKFCDIYGQIHDSPKSGVVMGQLTSPVPHQPEHFVRGSRLTSSANDVGQRIYEPRIQKFPPNRPLPPPPTKPNRLQVSDTESGSDASEIQRIMQNKTKNKKRGFFGK